MTGSGILSTEQRKVETKRARCGRWRSIRYHAKTDALDTIQQIRQHNQTGINAGCWRKDGK